MKRSFLAKYHENMVLFGLSLGKGLIRNGEAIMSQAQEILNALGGWDNLTDLQHCITRIRAFGVVVVGSHAQIVMGPQAEEIAEEINTLK